MKRSRSTSRWFVWSVVCLAVAGTGCDACKKLILKDKDAGVEAGAVAADSGVTPTDTASASPTTTTTTTAKAIAKPKTDAGTDGGDAGGATDGGAAADAGLATADAGGGGEATLTDVIPKTCEDSWNRLGTITFTKTASGLLIKGSKDGTATCVRSPPKDPKHDALYNWVCNWNAEGKQTPGLISSIDGAHKSASGRISSNHLWGCKTGSMTF